MADIALWFAVVAGIVSLVLSVVCNWAKISGFYFKITNSRDWKIYFLRIRYSKLLMQFDIANHEDKKHVFSKMSFGRVEEFFFDNHILLTTEELKTIKSSLRNPKTINFVVDNNIRNNCPDIHILTIKEFHPFEYDFSQKSYIQKPSYRVPIINLECLQSHYPSCVSGNLINIEEFRKIK